jgi:hypothetical protein
MNDMMANRYSILGKYENIQKDVYRLGYMLDDWG